MPRIRSFSIEHALDGALALFSERGYYGVSMQTIGDHLNLSRSTLYSTFGSKSALFAHALRHSCGTDRLPGMSELNASVSVRSALLRVFEVVGAREEDRPACPLHLLIDTVRGLPHRGREYFRLIEDTLLDLEARFREAIERARSATEIDSHVDPVSVARVLLSLYLGSYVLAGCGSEDDSGRSAVLYQVRSLLPAPRSSSKQTARHDQG